MTPAFDISAILGRVEELAQSDDGNRPRERMDAAIATLNKEFDPLRFTGEFDLPTNTYFVRVSFAAEIPIQFE